jgi:membrane fusion protein (multidrug efflux system)
MLAVVCACGRKSASDGTDLEGAAANQAEQKQDRAPVKVISVGTGMISSYITSSTTVDTEQHVEVFSKATGTCDSVLVEEGDKVKKGQTLAVLDNSQAKLAEIQARTNRDKLAASLKRADQMFNDELLSKEEFDDIRYRFESASAEWEMAKIRLEDTVITAPISGTIAQKNVKEGMYVTLAISLFRIVDFDSLIAIIFVPELEMSNLEIGQNVTVTADALPGKEFEGKIKRISPVVDPSSGTIKVTVDLSENSAELVPGVFIRARIVVDTHENVIILPKRALVKKEDRSCVFIVKDDIAHESELSTGYADGENVEVLSGLAAGDLVVIDGQTRLRNGTSVRIIDELPAGTG